MANPMYDKYTSSFSGTDMVVSFIFPNSAPLVIGTATTVNYSIYRQLAHVRTLGRITTKGFARGGRTVAGRIIFTVVKESIVEEIRSRLDWLGKYRNIKPDELPPFDILLTFANEFGQSSSMVIYGVGFTDETKVFSIEDIFTENVFTFLARDLVHMKGDASGFKYDGAAVLRGADEILGNFTLSELIATQEDAARKARLEEIARAEQERWQEPVMTDPGYPPPAETSGTSSSGGTVHQGVEVAGQIQVVVYSNQPMTKKLSGATVTTTHNGKTVSKTTDSNGSVVFTGLTSGKTYSFAASKSGYGSDQKNKKVDAGQTSKIEMVILLKNSSSPTPDNLVRVTKRYGAYSNLNAQHRLTSNFSWNSKVPQVVLRSESGKGVEDVNVEWTAKNLAAKPNFWTGKQLTIDLGKTKTNKDGVATFPKTDPSGSKKLLTPAFKKGDVIAITAKPYEKKGATSPLGEKYWWTFEFFIDY